ncbi:DUF5801 repeats-in-toxin domain-containing protein, partial [Kiloniella antarctica]
MTDDQNRNDNEILTEAIDVSGETGRETLVGQAAEAITVSAPSAGDVVNISLVKGQTATLDFDATAATPVVEGNDFILTFDTNGDGSADSRIVFQNLVEESQGADAPVLVIGGVELSAGLLIGQAQALVEGDTLETAAGAGAGPTGGGGSTYSDDLGNAIDLLNAQGVIDPTELQFGLLSSLDEITDPAQGTLLISFLTTVTEIEEGPDGGISGSFGGGFEDWLPNHHLNGGDAGENSDPFLNNGDLEEYAAPMRMVLTFVPSDNETLDTVVLNELPEGVRLFIGGSDESDEYTGGFPVTISPSDFADIYILPPQHSDADIAITGTATISDPDSGESATLGYSTVAIVDAVADMPEGLQIGQDQDLSGNFNTTDSQSSTSSPGPVVNSGNEEETVTIPVTVEFADFADDSEAHELVIDGVPVGWEIRPIPGAQIWQMDGDSVYKVTFDGAGNPVLTLVTDTSDLPASLQHQIALAAGVVADPDALHTLEETIGNEVAGDGYVRYFVDVSENVDAANNGNTLDTSDDGTGSLTTNISFDPNDWTNSRLPDGTPRDGGEGGESDDQGPARITVHAVATETVPEGSGSELADADGTPVDENNQAVTDPVSVVISIDEDIPEFTSPITLIHDETARTLTGDTVTGVDENSNDIPAVPSDVQSVLDERYKVLQEDDNATLGDAVGQAQNTFTYDLKSDGSNDEVPDGSDGPTDTDTGASNAFDDLEAIEFDLSGNVNSLLTSGGSAITLHQDPGNSQVVWGLDASGNVVFAVHIDGTLTNDGNTGNLTFVQYGPIDHDQAGDGGEGSHDENASFNLTIKLTDDEGDSVTATATINIEDDGPVVDVSVKDVSGNDVTLSLNNLDESTGADIGDTNADSDDVAGNTVSDPTGTNPIGRIGTASDSGALSDLFDIDKDAGTDGEQSVVNTFSLTLSGDAVATTLSVTQPSSGPAYADPSIELVLEGGEIIGRFLISAEGTDGSGNTIPAVYGTALRISLDDINSLDDADLTVEQYVAIDHGDDSNDHDSVANLLTTGDGVVGLTLTTTVTDGDGDTATDSATVVLADANNGSIVIEDDGPANNTASVSNTVEEDNLVDGNDEDASGSTVATGSVASLVDFGSDGAAIGGGFSLGSDLSNLPALTSNGLPVTYAVVGDTLTASTTAGAVFTLKIDANGDYTFTLLDQLDHHPVVSADDIEDFLDLDLSSVLVATDGDGDSVTIDDGFTIRVQDDVPVALDDALNVTDESAGNVVTGNLLQAGESAGADQPGTIREITHDGVKYELAADGQSVSGGGSFDPATGILTITTEAGATLTVDMAGDNLGDYSYEGPATHPGEDFALGGGSFDGASYTQTNPATGVTVTVTGAGTQGGNPVDVLVAPAADGLGVSNIPQGTTDTPYTDNGTVQESLTFSFSDAGGAVATDHLSFEFDGSSGTAVNWSAVTADGVVAGTSAPGENSFTITGNGITSVTLTAVSSSQGFAVTQVSTAPDTLDETFDYVLEDADGDQDGATLTVTVADDNPVANIEFNEGAEIRLDETDNDSDDGDVGGLLADVTVLGSVLFSNSSVFGADGPAAAGATEFNLSLGGVQPVNSGLVDAQTDEAIILTQEPGGDIVGSSSTGGEVFRVSTDPATGDVTVTQTRAVEHNDSNDHDENLSPAIMNSGVLQLIATVTDADGDQSDDSLDLGSVVKFEDDGPSISANATTEPVLTVDETVLG